MYAGYPAQVVQSIIKLPMQIRQFILLQWKEDSLLTKMLLTLSSNDFLADLGVSRRVKWVLLVWVWVLSLVMSVVANEEVSFRQRWWGNFEFWLLIAKKKFLQMSLLLHNPNDLGTCHKGEKNYNWFHTSHPFSGRRIWRASGVPPSGSMNRNKSHLWSVNTVKC
jgi:hypothetical protein